MLQQNKSKILELFFEEPEKYFQLREMSRLTKIAVTSVKQYLDELLKENLIKKIKKDLYFSYIANEQNKLFKIYKQQIIFLKLYTTGLVDYLENKLHPACMIFFGKVREGNYGKNDYIDIFAHADQKKINLIKFEKMLKHKINLIFEKEVNRLNNTLFYSILRGMKLSGFLKLKLKRL